MDPVLEPLTDSTLREQTTNRLRAAIIDGQLPPNSRLNEKRIAEELGISRGPVREALSQLEEEGLVNAQPHRGTFVAGLSAKHIDEIQSLREVLEGFSLRRADGKRIAARIGALELILAQMAAAAERGDRIGVVDKDLEFHREICACSHHELLLKLWNRLANETRRFMAVNIEAVEKLYGGLGEVVESHSRILEALRKGDLPSAQKALGKHIAEATQTMVQEARR